MLIRTLIHTPAATAIDIAINPETPITASCEPIPAPSANQLPMRWTILPDPKMMAVKIEVINARRKIGAQFSGGGVSCKGFSGTNMVIYTNQMAPADRVELTK